MVTHVLGRLSILERENKGLGKKVRWDDRIVNLIKKNK
jgi:hypothetical protein